MRKKQSRNNKLSTYSLKGGREPTHPADLTETEALAIFERWLDENHAVTEMGGTGDFQTLWRRLYEVCRKSFTSGSDIPA